MSQQIEQSKQRNTTEKKETSHIYPKLSFARAHKRWSPTWFCCGIHDELTNEELYALD